MLPQKWKNLDTKEVKLDFDEHLHIFIVPANKYLGKMMIIFIKILLRVNC